jgi:hypothetical protein
MTNPSVSQNFSGIPDSEETAASPNDITPIQEQSRKNPAIPKSLIDWLARINKRCLALGRSSHQDSG